MENNPTSPVGPNLFFVLVKSLRSSSFSPSKTKTVSTKCSKVLSPAISPILFIWPTIIKALFFSGFFARSTHLFAHSIVWVGEPCLLSNSFRVKVWIESKIIISASFFFISLSARSIEFVDNIQIFGEISPIILSALDLICDSLSSPEIYITLKPSLA